MSIITLPTGIKLPAEFTIGQARYDMTESSDATGSEAARVFGPPRWRVALRTPAAMTLADAAQWETVILKLRGRVNHLALYDPVRQLPAGTLRGGSLTLSSTATAGATTAVVTGATAGMTLAPGDWLQLGTGVGSSQLVKCMASATADGTGKITATIEPPIRATIASGAAVTVERALGYYKLTSEPQIGYLTSRYTGALALDLLESWA